MKVAAYFRSLATKLFHGSELRQDMDEELLSHLQYRADDLERSGLSRAEAERRARIEFGGRERFKEESYEAIGGNFTETLILDVRYSLRVLSKSPGFAITAVLTLGLAIGANAVVFGIMNGLILRPLNVPQPESLYQIERERGNSQQSYPDYIDLRDRNRTFDGLAAINIDLAALDAGDSPLRAWTMETSGNYFDVLRLQPFLGRFYHAADEHGPNSAPYIVLAHTYWQNHFQGDRGVVGRTVQLNRHPYTILGIAPPGFHGTMVFGAPDIFVPIVNQEHISGMDILSARGSRAGVFCVIGHLKDGVTPAQATADLNSIGAYLEKTYPKEDGHVNFALALPNLNGNFFGPPVRAYLTGLMLLAGLVLLAGCTNLGSLFAARAADRSREVALRLALGAKRTRILRTLFTEALLIALVGGAFGLWGSVALLRAMTLWQLIPRFPLILPMEPDAKVYLVALVLALVSGILFGLVPVRQVLRTDPYQIVKAGPGIVVRRRITVRDLLLAVQIAICAVLVTSSLVAVRGLVRSLDSNFGFEPRNTLLVNSVPNMAGYRGESVTVMQKRMIGALESVPGVDSVGLIDEPPLYGGGKGAAVFSDASANLTAASAPAARPFLFHVSPDYFRAAGTPLLAGRAFSWHDDENAQRVAVVNRQFAKTVFGSATDAVGRFFKLRNGQRIQVVGLTDDGKYFTLTEDPEPAMFFPFLQSPSGETWLVVRSSRDARQLAPALKNAISELDRGLPTYIATWEKELSFALFPAQVATMSLGVLGVIGAVLATTGIFGMAAYSVSKRLRDLGIRLALGAGRKEVLQSALGRALKLLVFGSAAGLVLGLLATKVLASIVFHATPRDPLVLTGVVFAMMLLGLLATWIPAQRALSVDPLKLLREE